MSDDSNKPDNTPGVVAWNELITPKKPESLEFYSKLFGWNTEDMQMPDGNTYTMFMQGQRPIAGCIQTPPEAGEAPPMWLMYVNVDDVDAAVAKARDLGAKICRERMDIPMGSFAIVTDPAGATFAFWKGNENCES